jgi:hypothetical protein
MPSNLYLVLTRMPKKTRGNLELLGRRQIGRRNRILLRDFRPSGAKNDPSDAKLLLDILILCF